MHRNFWSENLKGKDQFEDLGLGGRIILEWILRVGGCGLDTSGSGWKPVNAVINLRVPYKTSRGVVITL
jgi:hypothetical protein